MIDKELDERFDRMERALAALETKVDGLAESRRFDQVQVVNTDLRTKNLAERVTAANANAADTLHPRISEAPAPRPSRPLPPPRAHRSAQTPVAEPGAIDWITSKTAEWWLGRLGIAFVVLAIFFLFRYALEHNWITPAVRVLAGVLTGVALFAIGLRLPRERAETSSNPIRLRELLLSGSIVILYITGYAAAVMYQLIPLAGARLWFGIVSIAATWLALQHDQEVFALMAVAGAFAAPFLLPNPATSVIILSFYLAAVTALGLVLYLMRGWQWVLWATVVGFWVSLPPQTSGVWAQTGAIPATPPRLWTQAQALALSLLLVACGAAFTRVPALRRRLVVLNPSRYRESRRSLLGELREPASSTGATVARDSIALWLITVLTPLMVIVYLSSVWPAARTWMGGVAAFAIGTLAFLLGLRSHESDAEITQVEMTIGTGYTLLGLVLMTLNALTLPLVAVHAGLSRLLPREPRFARPIAFAKMTTVAVVLGVIGNATLQAVALGVNRTTSLSWTWWLGDAVALAAATYIVIGLVRENEPTGIQYATLTYVAVLLVAQNALDSIWPPLLALGYTIFGTALLLRSPNVGPGAILRRFGVITLLLGMVVVIGRSLPTETANPPWGWMSVSFAAIVIAAITWQLILDKGYETRVEAALAIGIYVALMVSANNAFAALWPPLVSVSYAFIGASLLIASRREQGRKILLRLGSFSIGLVALRLIFVDLAAVETIWRVLLFLVSGALFLFTAYRLQVKTKPAV